VSDAERLASLTGWPGRGAAGTDWAQVEARLRVALPADFRELPALQSRHQPPDPPA
jgi:hypothetical protein